MLFRLNHKILSLSLWIDERAWLSSKSIGKHHGVSGWWGFRVATPKRERKKEAVKGIHCSARKPEASSLIPVVVSNTTPWPPLALLSGGLCRSASLSAFL